MAKKALLKDHDNIEILPITRGELVLDSSGNQALHSTEFLATTSQPGLMSAEDKYKILNMQASSVANALTLKINGGSTEGTNLYTFNGSAAKTLNIVAGSNITLTPSTNTLTIAASIPDTIDAYTKTESDARYLPLVGGRLTAYSWLPLVLQGNNKDFTGLGFSNNGNTAAYLVYMGDKSWKLTNEDWSWDAYIIHSGNISSYLPTIPTVTDYYWANVKISNESNSTTTPTFGNINVSGNATATTFIGNLDGTYVNKLTGYTKATSVSAIATTDSLNTALGKLELKADTAYTLVAGAYDGDGTIENLAEILKVLEGIKDTETIKAIVGKYLPLTGGTIYNSNVATPLYIKGSGTSAYIGFQDKDTKNMGFIGMTGENSLKFCKSNGTTSYDILHSGNTSITNGTITINGISITPLTQHQDLSNYVTLNTNQTITGEKTFATNILTISNPNSGDATLKFYRGGNTAWTIVDTGGNLKFNELTSNTTRLVLYETSQGGSAAFAGSVSATGFSKSGSSDSYILLGAGGHKLISDFVLSTDFASKELTSNLTTITKTLTVTKDWMDTGIKHTDLATGTYVVQVSMTSPSNSIWLGIWSGVMSWTSTADGTNGTDSDEILLHRASHACNDRTIYLRTLNSVGSAGTHLRLQIAASTNLTSASYTFKFKKLI